MRAILAMVALAIASPSTPAVASGPQAVQPLTITRTSGTTTATCTLIHRDDQPERVVLYFITAGSLFRTAEGERLPIAASVVVGRGSQPIPISAQDILLPIGNLVDVALLRATVPHADLQPEPLTWEPPAASDTFVVSGIDRIGTTAEIRQRVRFASTMLVVGDRDASALDGCVGAPGSTTAGVFGVVTSCGAGRTPLVTLLRQAKPFISYYIPALAALPTISYPSILDRDVAGPAIEVPCGGINAGEIDVPLPLTRDERLVDVAPALVHSEEVRIADISLVGVGDRSVRLRFSVGGGPPSPETRDCPQPQALITLRVTLATTVRK